MFTGLVQDIGVVRNVEKRDGGIRIKIETNLSLENKSIGASICCAGVCLTLVEKTKKAFFADVSGETLSKTTLGQWAEGWAVNLEPSLRLGDELGGHLVSGHVDALACVESLAEEGESLCLKIKAPAGLEKFITQKGSVTLDGVSLTVNAVTGGVFTVNIIPHTAEKTTLSRLKCGDRVNIEVDMLARYVAKMLGQAA